MKQHLRLFSTLILLGFTSTQSLSENDDSQHEREKRSLLFPVNCAIGIIFAIAVPLDYPHRNIFVSYNFEANYNMPTVITDDIPGIFTNLQGFIAGNSRDLGSNTDSNQTEETTTAAPEHLVKRRSVLNRIKMYKMLESKITDAGHNGTSCLLRAICQYSAEPPFNEHNGVLGDIFHVILKPSSSMEENISNEYYMAEDVGRRLKDCSQYREACPKSVFDYITTVYD